MKEEIIFVYLERYERPSLYKDIFRKDYIIYQKISTYNENKYSTVFCFRVFDSY